MKKYLDFQGKEILFTYADGRYWVAIKPICEALSVDYSRQLRTLKTAKITSQLWSLQTTVAADGKTREMVCLPVKYIYGWIFRLNSNSELLHNFQLKCYEVLYDYFNGAIVKRQKTLSDKTVLETKIAEAEQELKNTDAYKRVEELKSKRKSFNKALKDYDSEIIKGQLSMPFN